MSFGPLILYDSGLGGLTVLKHLYNNHNGPILYFADTAFFPYGVKSAEEIRRRAEENIAYLQSFSPSQIFLACHTLSAVLYDSPLAKGIVDPTISGALESSSSTVLALFATPATLLTGIYQQQFHQLAPDRQIFEIPSDNLATFIEEGKEWPESSITEFQRQLTSHSIDTVILGCTHYPLLHPQLTEQFPSITFFDPSLAAAQSIRPLPPLKSGSPAVQFFVTGDPDSFSRRLEQVCPYPFTLHHTDVVSV